MPVCVGVAFKRVAKSYWFDPGDVLVDEDARVVVETARGAELGLVKIGPRDIREDELQAPLKRVLRRATAEDLLKERQNRVLARTALTVCQECVKRHQLPMKLLQAEYNFRVHAGNRLFRGRVACRFPRTGS